MVERAWLLVAIRGRRSYGGNLGYADVHGKEYHFDSLVPNARKVRQGDSCVFRDRSGATGVAQIESLTESEGEKFARQCPECKTAKIKERLMATPRFRCKAGHLFDKPLRKFRICFTYKAEFGGTYHEFSQPIPPEIVQAACLNYNNQHSIQQIDVGMLSPFISKVCSSPPNFTIAQTLAATDSSESYAVDVARTDFRDRVMREIRARRGQHAFRSRLIERYGARCMASGCELLDVVEAAHLLPYRGPRDNHVENGVLLHCDLHTLFDLDLLGIEPDTLRIHVHPTLRGTEYRQLSDRVLLSSTSTPSRKALQYRWEVFKACADEA